MKKTSIPKVTHLASLQGDHTTRVRLPTSGRPESKSAFPPEVVLQFAGDEGKDEGQESQQDVIGKNTTDEDHRALIALKNDLNVLGGRVLDRMWREHDEPHCTSYSLEERDGVMDVDDSNSTGSHIAESPESKLPRQLSPSGGQR